VRDKIPGQIKSAEGGVAEGGRHDNINNSDQLRKNNFKALKVLKLNGELSDGRAREGDRIEGMGRWDEESKGITARGE
jgi:hypothetical protein